jgi:hypothetical protein
VAHAASHINQPVLAQIFCKLNITSKFQLVFVDVSTQVFHTRMGSQLASPDQGNTPEEMPSPH